MGPGLTVTDPVHLASAKQLRQQYLHPTHPTHPTQPTPAVEDELARDLADYDRAFGLADLTNLTDLTNGEVA
ncbi:hypothetical protein GCM10023258_04500 [Terrabacter aeriphilus]|uniref:Uncharacterized protein n=1 Tax=Terrabacter aeriphilus TaxID=515662 RepID=A0ABP9J3F4_9MICO